VSFLALIGRAGDLPAAVSAAGAAAESGAPAGLEINLFWVITAALSFVLFLNIIWRLGFDPIEKMLSERQARIAKGLADAEKAAKDRAGAAAERDQVIREARRQAGELITQAQRAAEEQREADAVATRAELDRLRAQAVAEIAAERDQALAELRAQVADLALGAAGHVIGESMTEARQRRLVEDFLRDRSISSAGSGEGSSEGPGNVSGRGPGPAGGA
jgi:F-type H+-transporting ATPase subunit b